MQSLLRVAVVGAGSISREFALRHLIEAYGVSVVAVVDLQLQLAQDLARDVSLRRVGANVIGTKYRETVDDLALDPSIIASAPVVAAATELSAILDNVDICYIGTPPSSHAALALAALAAGKHVLLEKPIAVSDEDAEAIVAASERAWTERGLIVNINIGMRFSQAALTMKKMISEGYLDSIESMSLRLLFRQWPREWQVQPWVAGRAQGGPLLEVGTHWIFGLLEIVGHDNIKEVNCACEYPDGIDGHLCESRCSGYLELLTGPRVFIDVETTSSQAVQLDKDIYELIALGSNGKSLILYDFSRLKDGLTGADIVDGLYGRRECVVELVAAIRAGDRNTGNLVTPKQAQNVQRIISQIRRS